MDSELFDRQNRVWGIETTKKITQSSVCIYGLEGGLGTEIAKNLALCGIYKIFLCDNNLITRDDLNAGYYYTPDDIGKNRSLILSKRIKELNPNVIIEINNEIKDIYYDVLICVNKSKEETIKLNKLIREKNKQFISVYASDFKFKLFVDAGREHLVEQLNSENHDIVNITNILQDGIVETQGHDLQSGDRIEFFNMEGENTSIFTNKLFNIEQINRTKFKLVDFEQKDFKILNGYAKFIHKPVIISHKPLEDFVLDYNNTRQNVPMCSIAGGMIASEVIKLVSCKYMPISQWFEFDEPNLEWSKELEYKIMNSSWLIVGSGAIGCELLKNLAWLDVKSIDITDPDTIEKSNLSRQFLFRKDDIGKLKSEVATNKIKELKPNITINYYSEKVGIETKSFTDYLLKRKELTGIFNALDNINARKFMDEQAFNYVKPLFESGTQGTKGNTQAVIPYLTETYSNSNDPDNEKSFPVCTIKSFPNQIHHTIHWALEYFDFFNRAPVNVHKWLESEKSLAFPNDVITDIYLYTTKYKLKSWIECVRWAIDIFNENYTNQIEKLLSDFPPDYLTSEGTLFWSAGKKCPKPIKLDMNNEMHYEWIEATVKLLANTVNFEHNFTKGELIACANIFIETSASDRATEKECIEINDASDITSARPQVLDKDNDSNYHIKWIQLSSNLRAINYNIEPVDFYTTKGIAGKIIPAVSTTTSVVGGLIVLEMMKYLQHGEKDIEKYKSTFINLSDNTFVASEPLCVPKIKIGTLELNGWFKFKWDKDSTLAEFKEYFDNIFKSPISMITYNSGMLYSSFMGDGDLTKKFSQILVEICPEINLKNQVEISVFCEDDELEIPPILLNIMC